MTYVLAALVGLLGLATAALAASLHHRNRELRVSHAALDHALARARTAEELLAVVGADIFGETS